MDEPPANSADLRRTRVEAEGAVLTLRLQITDPEIVVELRQREGAEREQYAMTALRVGILALRQAGGFVDAEKLKHEGARILAELESKLVKHATDLDTRITGELKRYFHATDGSFPQRVSELVSESGEFSKLLKQHVAGDNSLLAQQLAKAVGDNSPLMKHLSPTEKNGLIETLTSIAEERLTTQSAKVLGEFDLNNKDGALNKLIQQIETNFDPKNSKSALGVLKSALEETQSQIRRDLSLDVSDDGKKSPLNKMQDSLLAKIAEIGDQQTAFQNAVSQQLGIKQVQARTTEGGFSFEHQAAEALKVRIVGLGDEFQSVGETPGILRRKTGDHLQTLGTESAVPGANIVYECKRDKSYRITKALQELDEAHRNRQADIGVFVMSAETLRENDGLRGEYPAALARYGNDIIAVWDCDDPATDVVLDAAIGLARALVVRAKRLEESSEAEEVRELNESIADIEKQFERFDKMSRWCDDIMATAKDVSGKAYDVQEELRKVLKRLKSDVKSLNEGLDSLLDERSE